MEIKLREVLISIVIVCVMFGLALVSSDKLFSRQVDVINEYETSTKIDSSEEFKYAYETKLYNIMAKGTIKTLDPVTHDLIDGEYMHIVAEMQKYVMKTRLKTYKCGEKTCTKTETYWTWETKGRERLNATTVDFNGVTFERNKFSDILTTHVDTIKTDSKTRYRMYVVDKDIEVIIHANDHDGVYSIKHEKEFDDVVKSVKFSYRFLKALYWFVWIIFTGFVVYGFIELDNDWID